MADLHPHGMDEVGWEKRWVSLAILGREDGSLPTFKVNKENWVAVGVCMAVWGVWWGPPGSQMADLRPHGMDEVGWEKRWVSLVILGREDGSLTLTIKWRMWTEFSLFWPWRSGRKSKICNCFRFPTLQTNILLVFKFKIEHIFAVTGGARPLKRVLVQRTVHSS